jgi:vacuolar-type H+-ATPase subunit F/Vma7
MLGAIFESRRELFGEIAGCPALAIGSLDWEWKKHPVIRLDLNVGVYSKGVKSLYSALSRELKREAKKYGLILDDEDYANRFANLIEESCNKAGEKAVVIIDEYDKPLMDTLSEPSIHDQIRKELKGFYGVLKSYDKYLRFVFLTGVTKFSRVSVFSDLNHLDDLTLDPVYADVCGITQKELETCFEPEITTVLENTGKNREEYFEELRRFYNGYRFSEKSLTVYNPFGLLNHFKKNGKFSPYWYETATPTFLVELVVKQKINIAKLDDMSVREEDFRKYDSENMNAIPLLYQTGYLTITDYNEELRTYRLNFPNDEVSASFTASLVEQYTQSNGEVAGNLNTKLTAALLEGSLEDAISVLRSFLAVIPYDIIKETENYYQTAVHLIFTMLGFNCHTELRIAAGRIDALVETKRFVYCFEFKLDKTADAAMVQIDNKDYLLPWKCKDKTLFKVGVNFNHEERNIGEWKYEIVEK